MESARIIEKWVSVVRPEPQSPKKLPWHRSNENQEAFDTKRNQIS